ncbi:MAG: DEAD/DEAH box helicase, partial [Deltaproteobacteria bacterium]|nr:DEAD/DEAH box helicase [Deltaproteobacteria bacterium]
SRGKPKLAAWAVTAYELKIDETVNLLCSCVRRRTLIQGVAIGDDLAYWSEALRFAGGLVAGQQYLPQVIMDGQEFHAKWEAIFSAEDTERLTGLAQRMPPVARAMSGSDSTSPPASNPLDLLKRFVGHVVDYLVRSSNPDQLCFPKSRKTVSFDSVHDAWLHALQSQESLIYGDASELSQLWGQVREWNRPIAVTNLSPIRLCFRLEEPSLPENIQKNRRAVLDENWQIRYLIQSCNDPSLIIPALDAWNPKAKTTAALKTNRSALKEYLLLSLGQAGGICPRIAESLKSAQPGGYTLDPVSAYDFLTEKAALLQQSGFTVMLPGWWTRTGAKARISLKANAKSPKLQASGGLSIGRIVEFDWEVALGGEKLSLAELEALAKLKSPLVQLRGQWVEVNADEIQAAIDSWKKKESAKATVGDLIKMAIGAKDAPRGLQFEGVTATGWVGNLLKQLEGSAPLEQLAPADSFNGTLRPYQARGFSWLAFLAGWGMGACLADDMGLGKTVQTLVLIQRNRESNEDRPVLLVCPTTVVNNWQKEAARFTPELPVLVHHGIGRNKEEAFKKQVRANAIVIMSYGLLHRDLKFLQEVDWAGLVLDEAQNIKNPETKQAKAARSLKADYRIALTGTPVENNVGDLWSIMEFLNPNFLGTQTEFKRRFFVPIQAEHSHVAAERLKRITGPFVLRRLKTDKSIISDLPEKLEMKVMCPLTKEQASLYTAVVRETEEALKSSEGIQRKGLVLATLSKLKQVCNHPAQFLKDNSSIPGRSGKLSRLTEMLEEIIEVGEKALVFSQFAEMGKLLQKYLMETFGREALFLHGGVTKIQRDRMVERYQSDGDGPSIFILSLKAGGTGLNLTAANHVFHFDRWWNPAVENQATDRAFRIGQTRNVQVHKFVCAGTLEEKIDDMIEQKKEIAENVVGAGEGWITELSNKDLKELWKLHKEAIGD